MRVCPRSEYPAAPDWKDVRTPVGMRMDLENMDPGGVSQSQKHRWCGIPFT